MRVVIDQHRCVGAGQCVVAAPETFDQREDDGTVVLLDAHPDPGLHASVRDAAEFCPGQAISLVDDL